MKRIGWKVVVTAGLLIAGSGTALGISPESKCEAKKNKIAGKYAFCRQKAEAKAIKKGAAPDYSKCNEKLSDKWAKAEQQAIDKGTACIDSVTDTAIQSFVTVHSNAVAAALHGGALFTGAFPATGQTTAYGTGSDGDVQAGAGLSYTDNGDGTITDNNTGLMWEKKNDSGGIHDMDNSYTWCVDVAPNDGICDNGTNAMDGTIVSTFLHTLNDVDGGGTNCFAGYCDWRIPNVQELESITDYEMFNPSVDPAFHQSGTCTACSDLTLASCSCTALAVYWSSSTYVGFPRNAWAVAFGGGGDGNLPKPANQSVRAVRGGL